MSLRSVDTTCDCFFRILVEMLTLRPFAKSLLRPRVRMFRTESVMWNEGSHAVLGSPSTNKNVEFGMSVILLDPCVGCQLGRQNGTSMSPKECKRFQPRFTVFISSYTGWTDPSLSTNTC